MFWTRWRSSVNGAMPIHCAPSPPICVMPVISPLPSGLSSTIVWQPMPAPTSVPSGALVELLCGQPEQKNGVRAGHRQRRAGGAAIASSARIARPRPTELHARAQARGDRAGDQVRVEVELGGQQRRAALVALADDARGARRRRRAPPCSVRLDERALLLDHEDLVEARARTRAPSSRLERPDHPELEDPHAGALQRALVEAEVGAAPGAGRGSVLPAATMPSQASRGALDAVHAVLARVGERELGARAEQRALQLERGRGEQVAVRHVLVGRARASSPPAAPGAPARSPPSAVPVASATLGDDLERRTTAPRRASRRARAGRGRAPPARRRGRTPACAGWRAATRRRSGGSRTCSRVVADHGQRAAGARHARRSCRGGARRPRGRGRAPCRTRCRARRRSARRAARRRAGCPRPRSRRAPR